MVAVIDTLFWDGFQEKARCVIVYGGLRIASCLATQLKAQRKTSEKLKNEFAKVERSYIPLNSIIRIDEVKETGEAKIKENKGQVSQFPMNIQPLNKKD